MSIMTVDIAPRQLGDPVYVSQGDIGRIINVHMYDGDDPYVPPAGVTPYIQGLKPSGLGFNVQGTIADNICTFSTTDEMTDEVGDMVAEVRLIKTGMDIGTANFRYSVEERPRPDGTTDGTIEVITDVIADALNDALEDIDTARATAVAQVATAAAVVARTAAEMTDESAVYLYTGSETGYTAGNWYFWNGSAWTSGGVYGGAVTDTTLSISGAPADAKAVGDALAEKADADDVGDLSQLTTTAKDNLVAAINEANEAVTGINGRLAQQQTGVITCESGSYSDSNGAVKTPNTARIRNVIPIVVGGYSGLTIPEGYQAWVFRLDKNGNHISAVGSWLSGNISFNAVLTSDTCFINLAIKNTTTPSSNISAEIETVQNGLTLVPLLTASESEAVKNLNNIFSVNWIDEIYINANGAVVSNASFVATDYIELSDVLYGMGYSLYLSTDANIVSFYTKDKIYISGVRGLGNNTEASGNIEYPSEQDAKYVRFSHCKVSSGKRNPSPIVRLNNVVEDTHLAADSVTNKTIQDGSVSRDKTDFIIHNPETNYIKKDKYSDGYINASGVFVPNSGWKATDYVSLLPGTKYYSAGLHGGYCAFYKADMSVIAAYGPYAYTVTEFTTPNETAYGRFSLNASWQTVEDAWINIKNEKPEDYGYVLDGVGVIENENNPCNYDGKEIAVFNKILCVGDSMTEGTFNHLDSGSTQWVSYKKYSYPTYLAKMTGVETTNLGHGGQTSVQWYNTENNTDLSGYDCAIIQLGINDYGTYGELGADTKTAFRNIINKLKTENNNIKIFVANIIPAISYSSAGYKAYSTALLEWLETEYATDKNVVPVDIQRYGHTGDSSAFNAGHLTALGYRMLARDYIGFISDYIKNNSDVFREVQFIGTNYWYVNPNS